MCQNGKSIRTSLMICDVYQILNKYIPIHRSTQSNMVTSAANEHNHTICYLSVVIENTDVAYTWYTFAMAVQNISFTVIPKVYIWGI